MKKRELINSENQKRIQQYIWHKFLSEESFIFKNGYDTLLGSIVLIVLPGISLFSTLFYVGESTEVSFLNYSFPLLSISLAGVYDAYGRLKQDSVSNMKLYIRIIIDIVAFSSTVFVDYFDKINMIWLSPIVLLVCSLILISEIIVRIRICFKLLSSKIMLYD